MCNCNGKCDKSVGTINRGFEFTNESKNIKSYLPERSTVKSAGYDFRIPGDENKEYIINPGESMIIPTNIKAFMLDDEILHLHVRSSIGIKKGLILKNGTGIIDSDYYNNPSNEGNIHIALYNMSEGQQFLNGGDKVIQGIFSKYLIVDNDQTVTERIGGTGSTGQ